MAAALPQALATSDLGVMITGVVEVCLAASRRGLLTSARVTGCVAAVLTTTLTVLLVTSVPILSRKA